MLLDTRRDAHRGHAWVSPGHQPIDGGADPTRVFKLKLPTCERSIQAALQETAMDRDVLLVEDDADMREILVELCGFLDCSPHPVSGLDEARAVLKILQPQVAVVDWGLSDGTGDQVVTLLEEQAPGCMIILATGHGARVTAGIEDRVAAILRKPYPLADLARLFRGLDPRR